MSCPVETMVGTVGRKNVITLNGSAPGPHCLHTSTEPHRDGLSPGPIAAWRALPPGGPPCQAPEQPDLCCSCPGPRRGP